MPLANLSGSKPQVDEVVGDKQCNESLESYALPLSIDSGLTYLHSIHPPTSIDIDSYPHVVFTSPHRWDPTVLEHDIIPELLEDTDTSSDDSLLDDPFFGEFVEMNEQVVMALDSFWILLLIPLVIITFFVMKINRPLQVLVGRPCALFWLHHPDYKGCAYNMLVEWEHAKTPRHSTEP